MNRFEQGPVGYDETLSQQTGPEFSGEENKYYHGSDLPLNKELGVNDMIMNAGFEQGPESERKRHIQIPFHLMNEKLADLEQNSEKPEQIERFRDEYYFLSSMYPLPNGVETMDGVVVPSVEIGYQADKFDIPQVREMVLRSVDGYAAKRLANRLEREQDIPRRPEWEQVKVDVMRWYVRQKFGRNPDIAEELLETDSVPLIEKNNWGDDFWGVTKVKGGHEQGMNMLGKLLMEVREQLAEEVDLIKLAEDEKPVLYFGTLFTQVEPSTPQQDTEYDH